MTISTRPAVLFDVFETLVQFGIERRPFATLLRNLALSSEQALQARRWILETRLPSLREVAELLARETGAEPGPDDVEAAERELTEHLASCHLTSGAASLLQGLRGDGYALALVSNLASVYVPAVERLGVRPLVDVATYSCDVGVTKPDPAIFRLTLEALAVAPGHATMVGNSRRADVLGAEQAGFRAIWLTPATDPARACLSRLEDLRSVLV